MKKLLAIVLSLVMLLGAMPALTVPVSAETDGYYTYSVWNGEATITDVSTSISGNITIPSTLGGYSVTRINDAAFSGCTGLTSLTIPDSVTSIGEFAFSGCAGLTSIAIPDSVTSIGNRAFSGCTGPTSIIIPDSVTSIGLYAFSGCTGLKSITIPDSVTSIGEYAFSGCTGLTSITIPFIGDAPESSMYPHFGYIFGAFSCSSNDDYVPTSLKEVVITKATSIEKFAFYNCTGLTSITIPDSVTSIGDYAFSGCTSLTSVTIGNGVTGIRDYAFSGCTSLTSVTIPDSVIGIGRYAFSECTGLTSVTFPDSDITIGEYAFYKCTDLTSITIPDSKTYIGSGAFNDTAYYNDPSNWANDVLFIGNHLIKAKTTLSGSYTVKPGTKSIASYAFYGCTGLTSVTIPDSVTSMGSSAFSGCTGLTSLTLSYLNFDDPLVGFGDELKEVVITGGKSIPKNAFGFCDGLTSITIPNSVTSIGEYAFENCTGLTSIAIPDSVTSIGEYAFENCTGLTDVWYAGSEDDRAAMTVGALTEATWHYDSCMVSNDYKHVYNANCDADCNMCGKVRETYKHTYDNKEDLICNGCGYERSAVNWEYDETTSTLILTDFEATQTTAVDGKLCQIYSDGDLHIVLRGENALDVASDYGIFVEGHLTISGDGSLTIKNAAESIGANKNISIDSGTLSIGQMVSKGGNVTVQGGTINGDVNASGRCTITVNGGKVTGCLSGGTVIVNNGELGRIDGGIIEIHSGTVECTGIRFEEQLTVTGGKLTVDGAETGIEGNIFLYGSIFNMTGGIVSIKAGLIEGSSNAYGQGAICNANTYVSGGELYIEGNVYDNSCDFKVMGGKVTVNGRVDAKLYVDGGDLTVTDGRLELVEMFSGSLTAPVVGSYKAATISGGVVRTELIGDSVTISGGDVETEKIECYYSWSSIARVTLSGGKINVTKGGIEADSIVITGGDITIYSEAEEALRCDNLEIASSVQMLTGKSAETAKEADQYFAERYVEFHKTFLSGDLTGDDKINTLDGLMLLRYLNGWNVNVASPEAMDVNADGKVNTLDGLLLLRYLNGWNVTLG